MKKYNFTIGNNKKNIEKTIKVVLKKSFNEIKAEKLIKENETFLKNFINELVP